MLIAFIIIIILYIIICLKPNNKIGRTSIEIVMGKTGIGKTTYLALIAKKYIEKGYKVYSNVYIKGTYKFNPKTDLGKYDMNNSLIIVDEAGLEFNARDFKNFSKDLYKFFTMHRHMKTSVLLSVQFWDRLDIVIRELLHRIYVITPNIFNKRIMKVKEIGNEISINDDGIIVQRFFWISWLLGGTKLYRRKKAWHMFDTHSIDALDAKDFDMWDVVKINKRGKIVTSKNILKKTS